MKKLYFVFAFAILSLGLSAQSSDNGEAAVQELLNKGMKCITKKDYKKAIEYFNEVLVISPDEFEAYAQRGMAKHYLKQYKEAIEDYNAALRLQTDYAELYHLRGMAKGELKDDKGACEDWEIACGLGEKRACSLYSEFCSDSK